MLRSINKTHLYDTKEDLVLHTQYDNTKEIRPNY